jgi:short subunit fatty acids transporter
LYCHYRSYINIIIVIIQVELANTVMMSMKRKMDDLQDDNSNDNEPESTTKKIKLVMETLSDYLNKVNILFIYFN